MGFAVGAIVIVGGLFLTCYGSDDFIMLGRCIVPKAPMFGSIKIDHDEKRLIYKCDEGFGMAYGRPSRYCVQKEFNDKKYYDWSGHEPMCYAFGRTIKTCPQINDPENGHVIVSSYNRKGTATFTCDEDFMLIPPESGTIKCRGNMRWSQDYPICRGKGTVDDLANVINDQMTGIGGNSADAKDEVQGNLRPGKTGLDLIFALDTSSSIGPDSMEKAKKFIKIIIGKFGVSNQTNGGSNGTRVALMTFSDKPEVVFNLGDEDIRSVDLAYKAVDKVKGGGGGTNFNLMLREIRQIYMTYFGNEALKNEHAKDRHENANRAVFIITDAKETSHDGGKKSALARINMLAKRLRQDDKFEIFAIGIGTKIKKTFLADIASPPYYEHVFEIKDFSDLDEIGGIISEDNIDYGKCGISGNTEASQDGRSHEGAWPWLGWLTVLQSDGTMITCGGAVLCDTWFMTLANCVTENTEDGVVNVDANMINVFLGDHNIQAQDSNEWMVTVKDVRVHPNYTGQVNQHGVSPFDIALLELDDDNSTRVKLNKFVRPLCFMESRVNTSYAEGLSLLSAYKGLNERIRGRIAGWGHMGRQKIVKPDVFPWNSVKQVERELQNDDVCQKRYPGLDTEMFICVGNVHKPEYDWCYGDVGGPLMVEMKSKRYTFLGLSMSTDDCTGYYKFSLFLNVLHPDINKWVERQLVGCNRVDEPIPYVEEEPEADMNGPDDGDGDDDDVDGENNDDGDDDVGDGNDDGDDDVGDGNDDGDDDGGDGNDDGGDGNDGANANDDGGDGNDDVDDGGDGDDGNNANDN